MRNVRMQTSEEKCARCGTGVRSCRCRGIDLGGKCGRPACTCWSELCCECGEEYARRFVGALLA